MQKSSSWKLSFSNLNRDVLYTEFLGDYKMTTRYNEDGALKKTGTSGINIRGTHKSNEWELTKMTSTLIMFIIVIRAEHGKLS